MKIEQSLDQLKKHLNEQLAFIESSCNSYDQGNTSEAKRIAVSVRTLVKNSKSTTSLLSQLRLEQKKLWDSSTKHKPGTYGQYLGLCFFESQTMPGQGMTNSKIAPCLDDGFTKGQYIDFEKMVESNCID